MNQDIETHVEGDLEAMAQRFFEAWHRAEHGERFTERHLAFESWGD
jgi:hypothetical protein